jgi:hypothetical protein
VAGGSTVRAASKAATQAVWLAIANVAVTVASAVADSVAAAVVGARVGPDSKVGHGHALAIHAHPTVAASVRVQFAKFMFEN